MSIGADLGSSSRYSNELQRCVWSNPLLHTAGGALKAVVGKVSLRVALMQRLVGPKRQEKSNKTKHYDRRKREVG